MKRLVILVVGLCISCSTQECVRWKQGPPLKTLAVDNDSNILAKVKNIITKHIETNSNSIECVKDLQELLKIRS